MNKNLVHVFSRAVFFLGVIIGFALAIVMIWNQVEATHYFFDGGSYEPFRGHYCPLLLAPTATGLVTAAFQNPTDQEINFYYRAEIGRFPSTRRVEDHVAVPAHQTKTIPLLVGVNDVDLLYFIFVKINVFPNALHGSQQSVCGIRVSSIRALAGSQTPVVAL